MYQPRKNLLRSSKGFTLIELLVVIAIIGLLSTIIAGMFIHVRKKARDARKIAEIKNVQLAIEQYAENNGGTYPDTLFKLFPLYLPRYPSFASLTDPTINNRDKFFYITDLFTPVGGSGTSILGYHLGVHLEEFNPALDNDADCFGVSTVALPSATSCFVYDSNVYTTSFYNTTFTIMPGGQIGISSDFNGGDTGTSSCSTQMDCVFDLINGH